MIRPDFLIVGAPRSATTSMQIYLRQHPRIFFPRRKEVHYFGSDLRRLPGGRWFVEDQARYAALFTRAGPRQIAGEASAMYLQSERAAAEIKAHNPQMKIIIQLRNPIDVMYSHHAHLVWAMNEDITDFEQALAAEPQRARGIDVPPYAIMLEPLLYRESVRYYEQVKRYRDVFGRDALHIVLYDDLMADTAGVFRDTLAYLGVDSNFAPPFDAANQHKTVRSPMLQRWTMKPPAPWRSLLWLGGDELAYFIRIKLQQLNSINAERAPMPAALRRRLCAELAPEVEQLGRLLERDLGHWVAS